jgi:hypothetical protein
MGESTGSENTLIRSVGCEQCGARMLWTQGAWPDSSGPGQAATARAAYQCDNGHVLDPAETPQCPNCGLHDTTRAVEKSEASFQCQRCRASFEFPR